MTVAARERRRVRAPLLVGSAVAWSVLLAGAGLAGHPHDDGMAMPGDGPSGLAAVVVGSVLMVAAMMAPLLVGPLQHVAVASLARRRARAVALFLGGYLAVWVVAAGVLMGLPALLPDDDLGRVSGVVAVVVVVVVVVVWQCSPTKQRCLNRIHAHPPLAAFGPAADRDAARFGIVHAGWCVGTCWALMLLACVLPWHLAGMALVTLWLVAERLDPPTRPTWRLRAPVVAARWVVGERLHGLTRPP